jgi:hypothetical protein
MGSPPPTSSTVDNSLLPQEQQLQDSATLTKLAETQKQVKFGASFFAFAGGLMEALSECESALAAAKIMFARFGERGLICYKKEPNLVSSVIFEFAEDAHGTTELAIHPCHTKTEMFRTLIFRRRIFFAMDNLSRPKSDNQPPPETLLSALFTRMAAKPQQTT